MERVTFFNEESGFAVLRVKVRGQRDLVTVLGSLPSVSAGEWLTAKGWWVRDKEHGLQFKAQILKAVPPTTSEGVERYLAGGFVKGVGPVLAKKLVSHFGAEVLGVIENNPADLEFCRQVCCNGTPSTCGQCSGCLSRGLGILWACMPRYQFSGFKSAFFNPVAFGDRSYAASAGCRSGSSACRPARWCHTSSGNVQHQHSGTQLLE